MHCAALPACPTFRPPSRSGAQVLGPNALKEGGSNGVAKLNSLRRRSVENCDVHRRLKEMAMEVGSRAGKRPQGEQGAGLGARQGWSAAGCAVLCAAAFEPAFVVWESAAQRAAFKARANPTLPPGLPSYDDSQWHQGRGGPHEVGGR